MFYSVCVLEVHAAVPSGVDWLSGHEFNTGALSGLTLKASRAYSSGNVVCLSV